MRTHAQVVVIGGGLIGCSILYHLAKHGWSDVVLLERSELTSGSTWHAAANIHGLHDSTNISRLQHYTMALYKELEAETGQGCGVFQPGSLYLAQTEAREHQLRLQEAKARRYGMDFYEVSRADAERLHPLVDFDGVRCIMFEPQGGNVDPSGVTMAYAAGARQRGAEIHRFTAATATEQQADGSWIVRTDKGDIRTQWVVNAAGLWAREVAALAGLTVPLIPTEHQYFVTETIPEIAALVREVTGKPLEVVQLSDEALTEGIKASGVPEDVARLIVSFDANTRSGRISMVTDAVEKLSGRKSRTLKEFLQANKAALAG